MENKLKPNTGNFWRNPIRAIVLSGLVAGTLDMLTALLVYTVILKKTSAIKILHSIASGVFGKAAYEGGTEMALYGLAFHFLIAFSFAIGYFMMFPYLTFLRHYPIINGLLYGVFVWMVMNLVVLPLVFTNRAPLTLEGVAIGMSILMCMIGLPVALITNKYYAAKKLRN